MGAGAAGRGTAAVASDAPVQRGTGGGVTVVCVYRTGGPYDRRWVNALKRGLSRYLQDFRFVCLTDDPHVEYYWLRPFRHKWPRWWSKLEIFRPDIATGPVLYMDLDTLPVGNLADLAGYRGEFAMIADLNPRAKVRQSGVMAFRAGPGTYAETLYESFRSRDFEYIRDYRGDGEWLHAFARPDADILQALYPGQIVSYKLNARDRCPEGARLVCGHGEPRFSDPRAGWAHRLWRSLEFTPWQEWARSVA